MKPYISAFNDCIKRLVVHPQFVQIKDTLINFLTKCNIANSRKKELEKDFKHA